MDQTILTTFYKPTPDWLIFFELDSVSFFIQPSNALLPRITIQDWTFPHKNKQAFIVIMNACL